MKKAMFLSLAFTLIILVGLQSEAFAQKRNTNANKNQLTNQSVSRPNWVDANGDGICDNQGTGAGRRNQGATRPNFVDANGDGICDNWSPEKCNGTGQGPNFVDADGDGVCDHKGTAPGTGNGSGKKTRKGGRR